jgi:hypothetical protein
MKSGSDNVLEPAQPAAASVCTDAGVYYAEIKVSGHQEPMRVALHGITTASQAAQALEFFSRLCPA